MSAKSQTVKVPIELVQKQEEDADAFVDAPLFEVSDERKIAHVLVMRTNPDEGTLGNMPPSVTELDIKRRWGGGTFQLQARDERNRPMKGGFRSITIAGDPIFESKSAQARWKRQQGIDDAPAPAPDGGIGIKDLFAIIQSTGSQQKIEADRRAAELEASHKREIERIRIEGEIRARERAAEDERRERAQQERETRQRKEDEEREERRRREDAERDERRRKDEEAARVRDREFQLQIAALGKKGSSDGSEMLLKGVELAQRLAPGGDDVDPVRAVAAAVLPGVLERFGGAGAKSPPAAATTAARPSPTAVTLDGEIGVKAQKVIQHLESEGYNPEEAIDHALGMLLKVRRKTAPDAAAAGAPTATPSSPPAAPNGTTRVKGRTTKK